MSLWGDDFKEEDSTQDLLAKIKTNKQVKIETVIKSKKVSLKEKMDLISSNVHRILGGYANNTTVIRSRD